MPKKRFGQHFLADRNILRRLVHFAALGLGDTVVEIGPGTGALTRIVAPVVRRVIAIEIDRDLIQRLRQSMPANVGLVEADALAVDLARLCPEPFHLLGNLPYNVSTALLKRFVEFRDRILDVTVMVQKEVADRILASPGSREYGPLSIFIQYYTNPTLGFTVAPGAFRPRPKVYSSVIRLDWLPETQDSPNLLRFVQQAFSSRRKKLINNLIAMFPDRKRQDLIALLERLQIPTGARPEQLSITDFLELHRLLPTEAQRHRAG